MSLSETESVYVPTRETRVTEGDSGRCAYEESLCLRQRVRVRGVTEGDSGRCFFHNSTSNYPFDVILKDWNIIFCFSLLHVCFMFTDPELRYPQIQIRNRWPKRVDPQSSEFAEV